MTKRDSLAVVGAGAIGGVIGWMAAEVGLTPTLCVRTAFDRLRVTKNDTTTEVTATVVTEPTGPRPYDWIVVATKVIDTPGAEPWLRSLVGPTSTVVVLQNGIGHVERIRPLVPPDTTILPALIYQAAERVGPGEIVLHSDGAITVPTGSVGARFGKVLAGGPLPVQEDDDFHTAAWRKLLSNVTANPLTALTLRRLEVLREPDIRDLAHTVLEEAVAVGRAEGARFAPDEVARATRISQDYPATGGTSMLYDRLNGRPTEHDHITGEIVARGAKHGIPTPVNMTLLALLRALDKSAS